LLCGSFFLGFFGPVTFSFRGLSLQSAHGVVIFLPIVDFIIENRNLKTEIPGEVSEWLIEQPWKGCVGLVPTAGSNPALSVIAKL
jgi:hypothetical protein